jgi:hypothetical protein
MGAPGILSLVAMRRTRKRQKFSSARHYDQISFRFRTAKTQTGHHAVYWITSSATPQALQTDANATLASHE